MTSRITSDYHLIDAAYQLWPEASQHVTDDQSQASQG